LTDELARFIYCCAENQVGFKATAGLHHPLRGDYGLTYDEPPHKGTMYGFLNVFIASCLAFARNLNIATISDILVVRQASTFDFDGDHLRWRGHELHADQISLLRATKVFSFGSCSFEEPTNELRQLGLLPSNPATSPRA